MIRVQIKRLHNNDEEKSGRRILMQYTEEIDYITYEPIIRKHFIENNLPVYARYVEEKKNEMDRLRAEYERCQK